MCHGLAGRESFDSAVVLTLSRSCVCVLGAACLCVGDKKRRCARKAPLISLTQPNEKNVLFLLRATVCAQKWYVVRS